MRTTRWRQFPRVSWGSLPGPRGSQMDPRTQKYKFSLQFWELSDSRFYSLSYFEATKCYFLVTLGSPGGAGVKNSPASHEMWVQSLGWERSPGVGNDNPLQDSCLEVSKDRVAWQITVRGARVEHYWTTTPYTHNLMNESWNVTKCAIHQWKWPQTLIVSFAKKSGCQQIFSNVVKFLPCVNICRWLEFHNLGEAFSVFHQYYPKLTMVFSLLMTLLLLLNVSFHWALTLSI